MFVITVCSKLADKPKMKILKKGKSRKKRVLHECVLLCFRWWSIHFLRKALLTVNIHRGREKTNSFFNLYKDLSYFYLFPWSLPTINNWKYFRFSNAKWFSFKNMFFNLEYFWLVSVYVWRFSSLRTKKQE